MPILRPTVMVFKILTGGRGSTKAGPAVLSSSAVVPSNNFGLLMPKQTNHPLKQGSVCKAELKHHY